MSSDYPEGIEDCHVREPGWVGRRASQWALLILGAVLAVALSGLLGGQPAPVRHAESESAAIDVKMPAILRNGMFFESEAVITAKRPIKDLVFAASPSLWRDLTQNTFVPAAEKEEYKDGYFRFSYGPVEAGTPVTIKIDFQINPSLARGTAGEVAVFDGDAKLVALPLAIAVRP